MLRWRNTSRFGSGLWVKKVHMLCTVDNITINIKLFYILKQRLITASMSIILAISSCSCSQRGSSSNSFVGCYCWYLEFLKYIFYLLLSGFQKRQEHIELCIRTIINISQAVHNVATKCHSRMTCNNLVIKSLYKIKIDRGNPLSLSHTPAGILV